MTSKISTNCFDPKKNPALDAVLSHQRAVADVEATIRMLEGVITAKKDERAAIAASVPNIDHLRSKREDLLASVALGQATNEDVKEFDRNSAEEKDAHASAQSNSTHLGLEIGNAVVGLNRKLDEAVEQLRVLHGKDNDLLRALFVNHSVFSGESYVDAAKEVKKNYLILRALDGLMKKFGFSGRFSGYDTSINLPMFNVPACDQQASTFDKNHIFGDKNVLYGTCLTDAQNDLIAEFRSAGVTLI